MFLMSSFDAAKLDDEAIASISIFAEKAEQISFQVLQRMEDLYELMFEIAKEDRSASAGSVCMKILVEMKEKFAPESQKAKYITFLDENSKTFAVDTDGNIIGLKEIEL